MFLADSSCLTDLISFYNKVTSAVDERKAENVGFFWISAKLLVVQQELDSKILVGSCQLGIFCFCDSDFACNEDPGGHGCGLRPVTS